MCQEFNSLRWQLTGRSFGGGFFVFSEGVGGQGGEYRRAPPPGVILFSKLLCSSISLQRMSGGFSMVQMVF